MNLRLSEAERLTLERLSLTYAFERWWTVQQAVGGPLATLDKELTRQVWIDSGKTMMLAILSEIELPFGGARMSWTFVENLLLTVVLLIVLYNVLRTVLRNGVESLWPRQRTPDDDGDDA